MKRVTLALVAGFLGLNPGCKCLGNEKPYVPYTIDSAPTVGSGAGAPTAAPLPSAAPLLSVDGGTFARVAAQQAPPGTSSWTLGKIPVTAPPGRFFLAGLVAGQDTVVAFVGDGGSMAGEVVRYTLTESGRVVGPVTLAKLPDWIPVGQDCTHLPVLSQVGPMTLWLDVTSVCQKGARSPNRYLAAIAFKGDSPGVKLDLRASDPAPGERLAFDADAGDIDRDGSDDLLLQVALEGAPSPRTATTRATVTLKFLARPAGMSRDTQEPAQSFRNLGPWYAAQATKREGAEQALGQARQARRLQVLLCSELGSPVVTLGDGSPISCGEIQAADDFRFVEARSLVTQGNLAAAFSIAAAQRELKTRPRRLVELEAAIEAAAPPRKVNGRPLKVMPVASQVALPIAFDDKGTLLVLSEEGVVAVDPATGTESPSQAPRWNPQAELVGDMKVQGGGDDCKAGFQWVQIQSGGGAQKLATTIPGNLGATCVSSVRLLPLLDRTADGLTVALQGEPVFIPKEGDKAQEVAWPTTPGGQGTARSPDGRWTAFHSTDHLLLRGTERSEVWKPATRFYLTACTVANEAKAAACLLERGVVLLTP